ncbi:MAG: PspC domain-containing protein [Coriobacteriia bacterium]|nr:PspC domain-containing protein [Coriobacteriia bacterium]
MSNEYPQQGSGQPDPFKTGDGKPALIIGIALIIVGVWLAVWRLGLVPDFFWTGWNLVRNAGWGVAIILIGVVIVMWSGKSAVPRMPARGTRLYRSRTEKWIGGVLGGLGQYFGIDPTLLRFAFIALMLANVGGLIVAYIIMLVIVPEEPKAAAGQ